MQRLLAIRAVAASREDTVAYCAIERCLQSLGGAHTTVLKLAPGPVTPKCDHDGTIVPKVALSISARQRLVRPLLPADRGPPVGRRRCLDAPRRREGWLM